MANPYCRILIAVLMASSACLAAESVQSQPQVAIITGEVRDPTSREITFSYPSPTELDNSEQRVVLDSLNRFSCELPVVRGTLVRGHYEGGQPKWKWVQWLGAFLFDHSPLVFFVEPGDSLYVAVEEGFFGPSYSFSGPNSDTQPSHCRVVPAILLLPPRLRRSGGGRFQAPDRPAAAGSV